MSYILEALKKSDQERNRGATPGLQTVQATPAPAPSKRSWWIYLLVLALLLNAGLIFYWLQPWTAGKSDTHTVSEQAKTGKERLVIAQNDAADKLDSTQSSQPQHPPQAAKETTSNAPQAKTESARKELSSPPQKPVAKSAQSQPVKKSAVPSANARQTHEMKDGPTEALKKPPAKSPEAAVARKVERPVENQGAKSPPTENPKSDRNPKVIESADSISAEKLAKLNSKVLDNALMARQVPTRPEGTPPRAAPEKPGVPGLNSLPIEIQKEIPALKLSFLVFSDKPQDRMVSINGEMKREGQEVAPGLKLEQITPEGAIFSYKNHRFQKGVF